MAGSSSVSDFKATLSEIESIIPNIKSKILIKHLEELKLDIARKMEESNKKLKTEDDAQPEVVSKAEEENKKPQNEVNNKAASSTPRNLKPANVFVPIKKFAWDQDGYNGKNVFIYVTLNGVGAVAKNVKCEFTADGFDLTVMDLEGKNYRLIKKPLNKEIDSSKSKFKVKKDRIVVTLRKVEGKFGPDHWTDLVEKHKAAKALGKNKDDPAAGIMDMMKQMYDDGDDKMKKTIGEAMMKSRMENPMKL